MATVRNQYNIVREKKKIMYKIVLVVNTCCPEIHTLNIYVDDIFEDPLHEQHHEMNKIPLFTCQFFLS